MLSEMAVVSLDEPWFALSKGKYESILNEALSEMEVNEPEVELSNCTELIKLLNQDDGLGSEIGSSLLPSPSEASNSRLGVTPVKSVQNNFRNAKEMSRNPVGTGLTMATGRVGSQMLGRAKRKRVTCKRNLFDPLSESSMSCFEGNRTQPRCANGKVSVNVGEKTLEVPTRVNTTTNGHNCSDQIRNELLRRRETRNSTSVPPNNSHCSRRTKTFSLDSGRRPSAVLEESCFQGHRLLGNSLNERLTVSDGAVIPDPDLSHAEVLQHVKVEGEWRSSCSNSQPYTTFASRSRSVKVELEDTVSERKLEQTVPRRNSEITLVRSDWKKEDAVHSPAQGGGVNLSACTTPRPRPEAINQVHSCLSGISCTARGFSLEVGGLRSKSIHRQQKSVVGNGVEHASSSWFSRRHSAAKTKYGNNGSQKITREVKPISSGSGETYQDVGKKVTSFDSSQYEPSLFGTSYESERNREDANTWKNRSELWVAVDKLMVRSMMHQILNEESEEALNFQPHQQRLKNEAGHSCPTELFTEVDRILPVESPEDFRLSVLNQVSNVQPSTQAEKPSGQRPGLDGVQHCVSIELSEPDPNQDAAYDLRIKLSAGDKMFNTSESFCAGNTPDPVNRTKSDSGTERVPVAPSLFGETGSGGILPKEDAAKLNTQKIELSRMSFKWKSNILHRLRKDQITANNWRLSETLSV